MTSLIGRRIVALAGLLAALWTPGLAAQAASALKSPPPLPTVSARSYTADSAKVVVTGAFQFDADIPLNAKASYSDGESTWLQFGASASKEANAVVVGPETYWPSGQNAQNGSRVTDLKNSSLVNASVCGGGVGNSPGRFKAFYRVWWK